MCNDHKSKSLHSMDDDCEAKSNHYQTLTDMKKHKKNYKIKSILAQCFVTSAVMLASASCGMPVGYSAILLPQLKSENGSLRIDDNIGSWIASLHSAATPFGSLLSGVLMDRCGRKVALQVASLPLIVGWGLIAFAHNHPFLFVGRLVAGLSAGLTAASGQVLIGEISEPNLRGMFSSVPFASYSFGILLVYALGTLLHWRYVAGLSTILPILAVTIFFFLPESPVWLVRNNKFDSAKKSLLWLRGGNAMQAEKETEHLIDRLQMETNLKTDSKTNFRLLFSPEVYKPFLIINVFNLTQILSGTYIIVFYAVDILGGVAVDPFVTAVLSAGVRFVFSLVASILLVLIGRRTLALISGVGTAITALTLAVMLTPGQPQGPLAAVVLLAYVAINTVGFMILPGVMLGELLPARVRGLTGGITFMIFNFVLFVVAKTFPLMKNAIGIDGVFWFFGVMALLASIFLYIMLPETKKKTLSQIEDYFKQSNVLWIRRQNKTDGGEETECN